jgi:hypothetical protein
MRRRTVVAGATLIAALALAGLPGPAGSQVPSQVTDTAAAAFTSVVISADAPAQRAGGASDPAFDSAGAVSATDALVEPGRAPKAPRRRASVDQPEPRSGKAWKEPEYTLSGLATFYHHGSTAMRLPRGTVVVICGDGGCIQRTVSDYGPRTKSRIVDLYAPDFFAICGCPSWSGTTRVTVSVY